VANIRLRSVKRFRVVSNVLSAVEDSEGQGVQEITRGKETHDGTNGEAGAVLNESGDVFKLGDVVRAVTAVANKELNKKAACQSSS
jgi:hypothetical protein